MRIELSILFCLMSIGASAQDVIIRKNGDEIQAKVLAVSDSEIDYKKWSNQNGPTYTMSKNDVFMIKYIKATRMYLTMNPGLLFKKKILRPNTSQNHPRQIMRNS